MKTTPSFPRLTRRTTFTAITTLILLSSCATTGDIPVDLAPTEEIYISPVNADGIQDNVTFDLSIIPLERTRITRYEITVVNLAGRPVRVTKEEAARVPWYKRILPRNRTSVTPPEIILWDGRDDAGQHVPDGLYHLKVRARDNRGNTGEAPVRRIVVDNTPPYAHVTAPYTLFTPTGDGHNDRIPIYQRRATREDLWVGRIYDRYGTIVRQYEWEGTPDDFEWDGTGYLSPPGSPARAPGSPATPSSPASGAEAPPLVPLPEGIYTYILSATDRAGNSTSIALEGIELELTPRTVAVALNRRAFSPNHDGIMDTITITPRFELDTPVVTWLTEIVDIEGTVQRAYRGTSTPPPIEFDGYSSTGIILPDGDYRALVTVEYRGGQSPRSASPPFVLDTTPPRAVVRPSRTIFSPDGDGRNDTVEIIQSSTPEREWIGTLENAAGEPVRNLQWRGTVSTFIWDGTDEEGEPVPDGTYTYTLTATDEAGNTADPAITRIRVDTRPTPVGIRASASRFSPNNDGLHEMITFTTAIAVPDGIESWNITIRTPAGEPLGLLAAGTTIVPEEIQWDGTISTSLGTAPGSPPGTPALSTSLGTAPATRLPDQLYRAHLEVTYRKGNLATAHSTPVQIDTTAPIVTITTTPDQFSPDGDGKNDILTIRIRTIDESPLDRWNATIYDREGRVFMNWTGPGAPLNPIRWDGRSRTGELVQSAQDYHLVVEVTDAVENRGRAEHTIPVDILVLRTTDDPEGELRIQITSIYFVPFTADYINLDADTVARNLDTLDRLAEVLKRYPDRNIRIEGHAVSVYWYDAVRADRENRTVLIPLSHARADAIHQALVTRGIPAHRMTTTGYGGTRPVVPHGDLENRWKSRRVEFVLQ